MAKRLFPVLFPIAFLTFLAVSAFADETSDHDTMTMSGQCSMHQSEADEPMSCCIEAMEKACADCCGEDCLSCCGDDCQGCCMVAKPCSCGEDCEAGKCDEGCKAPCSGAGACCVDEQCSDCPDGCDCCAKEMACGDGLCSTEGPNACCAEDACLMGDSCATGECEMCAEHCAQCCTGCSRMNNAWYDHEEGGSMMPCCEAHHEGDHGSDGS